MEVSFKLFTVFESVELGGNFEIYKTGEKMCINNFDIKYVKSTPNKEVLQLVMRNNYKLYVKGNLKQFMGEQNEK